MQKTGPERLIIGCQRAHTARHFVWSEILESLEKEVRRRIFIQWFYGKSFKVGQESQARPLRRMFDFNDPIDLAAIFK